MPRNSNFASFQGLSTRLETLYNPFTHSARCIEFSDNRSKPKFEEKGRRYLGKNDARKEVTGLRVDGCLITEGTRCDFLLLVCAKPRNNAYFVELKGADREHGYEQLLQSINKLKSRLRDFNISARLVVSKVHVPEIKFTSQKKLEALVRDLRGSFVQGKSSVEDPI